MVGVATLRQVHTRRELIVGSLPMLFAVHQLIEAFVWLGLRGDIASGIGDAARDAYVLIAHVLLPALVPTGFLLIEPLERHRRRLITFVVLGLAVASPILASRSQVLSKRIPARLLRPPAESSDPVVS